MSSFAPRFARPAGLALFAVMLVTPPSPLPAQAPWPFAPPPPMAVPWTPDAQRNALNSVRSQVNLLQNTTRTAPNYTTGAIEMVWQQFQMLRGSYANFRMTLNPQQLDYGANELAELDAGLDILQEGFGYYQNDVAAGRPPRTAIRDLCQYLRQGSGTWLQQLNWVSNQLRVGW